MKTWSLGGSFFLSNGKENRNMSLKDSGENVLFYWFWLVWFFRLDIDFIYFLSISFLSWGGQVINISFFDAQAN